MKGRDIYFQEKNKTGVDRCLELAEERRTVTPGSIKEGGKNLPHDELEKESYPTRNINHVRMNTNRHISEGET